MTLFQFGRRAAAKQYSDEQRRVMAINVAGQLHQVGLASGSVTADKLLETARQIELYVLSGTVPAKLNNVTPLILRDTLGAGPVA